MSITVKQQFLTPNQYTRPQIQLTRHTAVAIHYTGDPGATAQNEHDYFNGSCISAKRYASCHYVVGMQGEIIQLIPETEWSYCTNQANGYTISIETCHADATGKFTQTAEQSLIELAAQICKRYGLNPLGGGVVRHYDVTGKQCPLYYVTHPACWTAFKTAVHNCMNGLSFTLPSSGVVVGSIPHATAANPNYCDTTGTLNKRVGEIYQFKTGSSIVPGTAGVFKQIAQTQQGGYYFTKFQAVRKGTIGFYVNGQRVCIGNVS